MRKYVYRIYIANNTVNCEKHPVIYENENYIYYKTARKQLLSFVMKSGNYKCLNSISECDLRRLRYFDSVVLQEPTEEEIELCRTRAKCESKEREINNLKNKMDNTERTLNNWKVQLKRLEEH
ncbi:MAG: hypothetical protein ACRC1P_09660 [Cellulosilyticaceae bacterium]